MRDKSAFPRQTTIYRADESLFACAACFLDDAGGYVEIMAGKVL